MSNGNPWAQYQPGWGTNQPGNAYSEGAGGTLAAGMYGKINNVNAPAIDTQPFQQAFGYAYDTRNQALNAMGLEQSAAMGQQPSAAEIQSKQALDESIRNQAAMANSARGNFGLAAAQRNAAANVGQMQQQQASNAAQLRAGEMAQARGAYGQMASGIYGQDLSGAQLQGQMATNQANLIEQQNAVNEQAGEANLKAGQSAFGGMMSGLGGMMALSDENAKTAIQPATGMQKFGAALAAFGGGGMSTLPTTPPGMYKSRTSQDQGGSGVNAGQVMSGLQAAGVFQSGMSAKTDIQPAGQDLADVHAYSGGPGYDPMSWSGADSTVAPNYTSDEDAKKKAHEAGVAAGARLALQQAARRSAALPELPEDTRLSVAGGEQVRHGGDAQLFTQRLPEWVPGPGGRPASTNRGSMEIVPPSPVKSGYGAALEQRRSAHHMSRDVEAERTPPEQVETVEPAPELPHGNPFPHTEVDDDGVQRIYGAKRPLVDLQGMPDYQSDERSKRAFGYANDAKRQAPAERFLSSLQPYSYQYKAMQDEPRQSPNGGRYLGVMAQDVEQTPEGKQIVEEGPRGKMINGAAMTSALAAGEGDLHQRVSVLEEALASRKRFMNGRK